MRKALKIECDRTAWMTALGLVSMLGVCLGVYALDCVLPAFNTSCLFAYDKGRRRYSTSVEDVLSDSCIYPDSQYLNYLEEEKQQSGD